MSQVGKNHLLLLSQVLTPRFLSLCGIVTSMGMLHAAETKAEQRRVAASTNCIVSGLDNARYLPFKPIQLDIE